MSDVFKADGGQKDQKGGAGFRVPARTWIIWLSIFVGIMLLMFIKEGMGEQGERISQYQFEELVDSERIARATIIYDQQSPLNEIVGTYYKSGNRAGVEVPLRAKVRLTGRLETKLLSLPQFEVRQPNTMLMSVVWSILPILIIAVLIWFFFIRQIRRVTNSPSITPMAKFKCTRRSGVLGQRALPTQQKAGLAVPGAPNSVQTQKVRESTLRLQFEGTGRRCFVWRKFIMPWGFTCINRWATWWRSTIQARVGKPGKFFGATIG